MTAPLKWRSQLCPCGYCPDGTRIEWRHNLFEILFNPNYGFDIHFKPRRRVATVEEALRDRQALEKAGLPNVATEDQVWMRFREARKARRRVSGVEQPVPVKRGRRSADDLTASSGSEAAANPSGPAEEFAQEFSGYLGPPRARTRNVRKALEGP